MDRESVKDQGTNTTRDLPDDPEGNEFRAKFKEACNTAWNKKFRSSLIKHTDLLICKGCLGVYSRKDETSTHPKDQAWEFYKIASEYCITTSTLLDEFLWREAILLLSVHGNPVLPSVTPIHKEYQKKHVANKTELQLLGCQGRIVELIKKIEALEEENIKTKSENRTLTHEMEELLKRMMTDRRILTNKRFKAELHLTELNKLMGEPDFGADEE